MVIEVANEGRDAVVAGWFRLRLAPQDRDLALMTCWLGKEFQGRGTAKSAVAEALRLAMPELGASRIGAYAMQANRRSIRVLEECGLGFMGERAVFVPAKGRIEVVFLFERMAQVDARPLRHQPLRLPIAA